MTLTSIKVPDATIASSLLLLLLVLVLPGADTLNAQQSAEQSRIGSPAEQKLVLEAEPSSHGCPVSMQAKQAGLGDLIEVRHFGSYTQEAMQQIRLTLDGGGDDQGGDDQSADHRKIVSARVTVRGTSTKGRAIATVATNAERADKTTTLDVRFSSSSEFASAKLVLSGFTSVTSITLKSLTYSDGSTWTPSLGEFCRTTPDPLVLVGAR